MAPDRAQKWEKWSLFAVVLLNVIMLAFSYGQVTTRIAGVESSIQDIKQDIHELRGVVLEKK